MNESRLTGNDTISEDTIGVLVIFMSPSASSWFNEILQQGFFLINPVGISVHEFLTKQIGLDMNYIGQKLSTILLDGKIIGDITSAIIKRGSVLALSSAMPGFVGATLSSYQSPGEPDKAREINSPGSKDSGIFCIKLFNLPMLELGPSFLRRGILLRSLDLEEFLKTQPDAFWNDCNKILLDGREIDPVTSVAIDLSGRFEWLRLSIQLPKELNSLS
jgi:hypothetical protein